MSASHGLTRFQDRHPFRPRRQRRHRREKFAAALFTGSSAMMSEAIHSFVDTLTAKQVEETVTRLEQAIRAEHPDVTRIFIEAPNFDADRRGRKLVEDKRRGRAKDVP